MCTKRVMGGGVSGSRGTGEYRSDTCYRHFAALCYVSLPAVISQITTLQPYSDREAERIVEVPAVHLFT